MSVLSLHRYRDAMESFATFAVGLDLCLVATADGGRRTPRLGDQSRPRKPPVRPTARRRTAALVALGVLALTAAGCGRSDLHGSAQTREKYNDLNHDPLYRARLSGLPVAGIPIVNAGSAGEGPGDSSTNAHQHWRSPTFGADPATAASVVTFAVQHGIGSFSAPRCSAGFWTIGGLKQYGPWVAEVAFYLEPGTVSVNTDMGVGDNGRQTLADARARNRYLHQYDPPTTSKDCPPVLLDQLKRLGPLT
jgi:hypothetical protein